MVAVKARLDLPGNMLANGELVKLGGPIIGLVEQRYYRNIDGKHSASFGSGTDPAGGLNPFAPQRAKGFKHVEGQI